MTLSPVRFLKIPYKEMKNTWNKWNQWRGGSVSQTEKEPELFGMVADFENNNLWGFAGMCQHKYLPKKCLYLS